MSTLLNYSHIHIEVSSKCTLKCPRCPRTELDPEGLNKDISIEEFQRAFDTELLQQIEKLIFCGDIGDPIYARDFLKIISYIKNTNPAIAIAIVTNGSYKSVDWWKKLGSYLNAEDQVTFSVDGWDQISNEQYRVNSDFDSIVAGVKTLRANSDCVLRWSAIYFNFNEKHMDQIAQLARSIGIDIFHAVKSSKFDNKYLVDGVDTLKPANPEFVANNNFIRVPQVFDRLPAGKTLPSRDQHPWAQCVNWNKELFVNVDGLVFPCAWFNNAYLDNDFVQKYQERISIKNRSLLEIVNDPLWKELYQRFDHNPLDICKLKCRDA